MVYHADTIDEVKPEPVVTPVEAPPVVNMEYDTPPPEWVPGTVVPQDTAPEDMTPTEYIQWMYDNWTPFWAIKKNLLLRYPPVLSGLEPTTAAIGDPSFTLKVSGTGFIVHESTIVFAGLDEPTQLNEDGTVSTGVNMDYWHGPDVIQVQVRNGTQYSEPLEFTFTAAAPEADAADADAGYGDEPAKKAKKKK